MTRLFDLLALIYKRTVVFFMRIILPFLFVLAMISTSALTDDISEETYFIGDNVLVNIFAVSVFVFFLIRLGKSGAGKFLGNKKCTGALLVILAIIAFAWVYMSRYTPRSDQMAVYAGVRAIREGDFSGFAKGEYFSKYPHQMGLVYLYCLWSFIFGAQNLLAFQCLNALGVICFYKKLGDICVHLGMGEAYRGYMLIFGIVFYPLVMYSSFIYGNVLGLAFSVAAIDYEIRFLKNDNKFCGVLSILFIMLGIFAKKNYEIFLLAMLILAVFEIAKKKRTLGFVYIVCLVAVLLVNSAVLEKITYRITRIENEGAMSSWSYVAIGLLEGPRANGWHNNFEAYSYEESGYNADVQKELALSSIKWSCGQFIQDPGYALEFFLLKTASQWNNPTFECHWINQVCDYEAGQNKIVKEINSPKAGEFEYGYLDIIMLIVLLGAMLFFWLSDEYDNGELILATVFVGGFLFHLLWEGKAQYTLSYFVLLFPYATCGYKKLGSTPNRKKMLLFAICAFVAIAVIGSNYSLLVEDSIRWNQYITGA